MLTRLRFDGRIRFMSLMYILLTQAFSETAVNNCNLNSQIQIYLSLA